MAFLVITIIVIAAGFVGLVAHVSQTRVSELEENYEASTAELQASIRDYIRSQSIPEIHVLRSGHGWTTITGR